MYATGQNHNNDGPHVWRFNEINSTWSQVFSDGPGGNGTGNGIGAWGSASNDFYVVGELISGQTHSGRLYHFDGVSWLQITNLGTIPRPGGIAGTAADDIWVSLGTAGTMLHYAPASSPAFTPGDIVVLRVQDNSGVLTNFGARILLDEYTTNGLFVQTLAIPTNGANALAISGYSISEGSLTRAPNGRWLCFGAYHAPIGAANLPSTSSVQFPRTVAAIDIFGNLNLVAANTNFYNENNMRGAVSDGTNNFWGLGAISGTGVGGLDYYGYSGPSNVVYAVNLRVANLINSSLYYSTAGAGSGIYMFNGAPVVPTAPSSLFTTGAGSSPYGFSINPAGNLAYVADDRQNSSGGIQRWTKSAGTWSLAYTLGNGVANSGALGLTVEWSGTHPVIYASTSDNTFFGYPANRLIRIADTGAGSAPITFAIAATNSSFRGVAFVPAATGAQSQIQSIIPENSDIRLYWRGIGGSNYVVQAGTNLSLDSAFSDITAVISLPGSGVAATNYLDVGTLTNSPTRFYRIRSN
jgi:hypothetical protein